MGTENNKQWIPTNERFVGFFDIMGFKDFVYKNNHEEIKNRVQQLTNFKTAMESAPNNEVIPLNERIRAIVVSDSVIISTLAGTKDDLVCLLSAAGILINGCLKQGIPIKGGLSYGKFTFDEEESLFVGKPLIDAAHLESTLEFYGCVIDHNIETKMVGFGMKESFDKVLTRLKVPTKEGVISYKVLIPMNLEIEEDVSEFYKTVSGKPRRYVDNTLDVYKNEAMVKLRPKN